MIITGMNQSIDSLGTREIKIYLFYLDINRASTGILGSFLFGKTEENLSCATVCFYDVEFGRTSTRNGICEVIPHLHLTEEVLGGLADQK